MHPFVHATTLAPSSPNNFVAPIDAIWFQGRGAYGGLVSAQLLRAFEHVVAADSGASRRPRSLTVHFCAPVKEGSADIEVVIDRKGAWVSHLSARMRQNGEVVATASSTFASPRPTDARIQFHTAKRPEPPPPESVEPVPEDIPMAPAFTRLFQYRLALGEMPYSGAERAYFGGWVNWRTPLPMDHASMLAFLDALPPAVLCRVDGMRAAASVDWTVQFLGEPTSDVAPGAPWILTAETQVAADGYAEEVDSLYRPDGRLVAQAHQTVALL